MAVRQKKTKPPVITSEHGQTTEAARRRAAENMYENRGTRMAVEDLLATRLGSKEAGAAESRRRYPEAYRDEVKS